MSTNIVLLTVCFFIIALIYSSAGFGGGSSYLALLAQPMFMLSQPEIKSAALLCNIVVVTGGTIIFYREGKLQWRDCWPYMLASVPLAYAGGYWKLADQVFFILLGAALIVAAVLLWLQPRSNGAAIAARMHAKLLLGGSIGLLSGLVSIGGGIFLSPALHFLQWLDARRIAALASAFILVNSVGGLAGMFQRGAPLMPVMWLLPLLVAVFAGGQIGSRLGAKKFNLLYLKRITACIIAVAGINILIDRLW